MFQKKDIETLRMLFSSHNYVMITAELTASKLYYADIKQLLDEGLIEKIRRGYHHWTQPRVKLISTKSAFMTVTVLFAMCCGI